MRLRGRWEFFRSDDDIQEIVKTMIILISILLLRLLPNNNHSINQFIRVSRSSRRAFVLIVIIIVSMITIDRLKEHSSLESARRNARMAFH